MKFGILATHREWTDRGYYIGYAHYAIAQGLGNLGHEVVVVNDANFAPDNRTLAKLFPSGIDAAFLWNGPEGNERARIRDEIRASGRPVFIIEHGFLQRRSYVQIDHISFNHLASWATKDFFDSRLPMNATQRLREVCPGSISIKPRPGYVLVFLQDTDDRLSAYLRGLDIRLPGPLVTAVEQAAPVGVEIRIRAHPLDKWSCGNRGRARMASGTFEEDVAGAAFCITINSGAGIEAMMMGCPVLSLGPCLYAIAGVSLPSSKKGLGQDMAKLLDGWHPEPRRVLDFFSHLACRQWSFDELARGDVLKPLLEAAQVETD